MATKKFILKQNIDVESASISRDCLKDLPDSLLIKPRMDAFVYYKGWCLDTSNKQWWVSDWVFDRLDSAIDFIDDNLIT